MQSKCARRRGESTVLFKTEHAAQARARLHVRGGRAGFGRRSKHIVFLRKRENVHRTQARANFSKCAPHACESSILPTQDGAHDHLSKQHEHRAVARAPFSIKMCATRRREAQECPTGGAEVLPVWRRAPYMSQLGPIGCPRHALPATILKATCIWTWQGIALAQRSREGSRRPI